MRERNLIILIIILVLAGIALWVDLPIDHPDWAQKILFWQPVGTRNLELKQGLDLQGGLQVLLEADVPADEVLPDGALDAVKGIIESRVNALGVTEPLIQIQGGRRIIVELPGIEDPDQAVETLKGTGLLEFVATGDVPFEAGTPLRTSLGGGDLTSLFEITPTLEITPTGAVGGPLDEVYDTIMSGKHLETAAVTTDEFGRPQISFELTGEGAGLFADYTRNNIGKFVCITMDKAVISCPRIESAIPDGQGRITSQQGFALDYARGLAVQMRYGALPVPMKVVNNRTIGATLGQDSVQKSITAGIVGLSIVLLFMLSYYRLPGLLADLALVIYALLNLAVFKLLPVVLTLPGIAGFLLSTGMAVDANVLIFERMKEELRAGRSLGASIEAGFSRAWTSILDSNLSTLITCAILYYFGGAFGASTVRGFALTLGIGVLISMFTAVIATRTFVRFVFDVAGEKLRKARWLLGV
ncbi:MAG TPA: protein translocase subunit SecD [Anaerolineae bacterium]|nr:protein translocase subunit SecD [Anaerolineae bacterium]